MFLIGFNDITGSCKDTCQKSVVIIFEIIMVTDGFSQKFGHFISDSGTVCIPDSLKQCLSVPGSGTVVKPFDNGSLKDFTNFSVWNFQRIDTVCLRGGKLYVIGSGQITGQVKNTPQIIFGRMEIIISKIFIDVLKNVFTGEQFFKLFGDGIACIINKRTDNGIITGVFPIT